MKKDCSVRFQQSALLPWIELKNANQSSACFEAHSHDEFSFGIIERGQAVYRNRQCIHQIGQGDLVTINPADVHSCNPELGAWSYRMLFVDAIKMGEMQQDVLGSVDLWWLNFVHSERALSAARGMPLSELSK